MGSGAYEGKERISHIDTVVLSKNKIILADSHSCIVGMYILNKIPYSKFNNVTNNWSSRNDHNMLRLAS